MKKLILMAAVLGMTFAATAGSFGDDKNKKECAKDKKECSKEAKSCCKSAQAKSCSKSADAKACSGEKKAENKTEQTPSVSK
jgi:hypothetical protein